MSESFTIKDVNCNFLLQQAYGPAPLTIKGDPRTIKPTTVIKLAKRGKTYSRKGKPPKIVPGIVVGWYSTATPRITNTADYITYKKAERASFEMFNFIYKVWTPCVKAELTKEDFEDSNKKKFERKVAGMADVTVSLGVGNVAQGAIPPGTLVDVEFANRYTLKNPQIVKVKGKIFDISSVFRDPPGRPFKLGSSHGPVGTVGRSYPVRDYGGTKPGKIDFDPEMQIELSNVVKGSKRTHYGNDPLFAHFLRVLDDAARAEGIHVTISSAVRTSAAQARAMFGNYWRKGLKAGDKAAARAYLTGPAMYGRKASAVADIFDQHTSAWRAGEAAKHLVGLGGICCGTSGTGHTGGRGADVRWGFTTTPGKKARSGNSPPDEVTRVLLAAARAANLSILMESDHFHMKIRGTSGTSSFSTSSPKGPTRANINRVAAVGLVKGDVV